MSQNMHQLQRTPRASLPFIAAWTPLFTLWGIVWIVSAAIDFAEIGSGYAWIKPGLTLLAVLISAVYVTLRRFKKQTISNPSYSNPSNGLRLGTWLTLPLGMIAASALLLRYIQTADPFVADISRSLLLAFFYVLVGVFLGKPLVYLGLWLFALTAVISLGYLGFAPMVLEFFGGLSLLVCARIVLWRNLDIIHS